MHEQRSVIREVSFSRDSRLIAAASQDGTVLIWQTDGTPVTTFRGHQGAVNGVRFSPNGDVLASTDENGNVML